MFVSKRKIKKELYRIEKERADLLEKSRSCKSDNISAKAHFFVLNLEYEMAVGILKELLK
jgi:hypothetical protein